MQFANFEFYTNAVNDHSLVFDYFSNWMEERKKRKWTLSCISIENVYHLVVFNKRLCKWCHSHVWIVIFGPTLCWKQALNMLVCALLLLSARCIKSMKQQNIVECMEHHRYLLECCPHRAQKCIFVYEFTRSVRYS